MNLEWMGQYRGLVEQFIRLFNIYARQYSMEYKLEGTNVTTSSAQIQTLEYIIEANGTEKMTAIADKIGVTRGTFSNNVKKLMEKGYLEKYHDEDNRKDIYLKATEKGITAYEEYSTFIYQSWFQEMFVLLDTIPEEHRATLEEILKGFAEVFSGDGSQKK